jgi:ATP synthase protein I
MNSGAHIAKPPVYRISLAQIATLLPVCVLILSWDRVWAVSALCGGLVAIAPQAWFAARAFRYGGARSAREVARSGYAGEVGKFLLSAAGFAAVFILLRPVSGAAVFAGYLSMLAIQITGSWILLRRSPR